MARGEPPDDTSRGNDDYLLLFQRLLHRFSEHARALADLEGQLSTDTQALERLDTLLTAQATELSELREASRLHTESLVRLETQLDQVLQAVDILQATVALQQEQAARPWWRRWWARG
jgi:hypothetical protein